MTFASTAAMFKPSMPDAQVIFSPSLIEEEDLRQPRRNVSTDASARSG